MKLQQCRPSFFDARDAIIQADQVLTGGENFCTLWQGFAERGLGPDARVEGRTPWGGGIRTNVSSLLPSFTFVPVADGQILSYRIMLFLWRARSLPFESRLPLPGFVKSCYFRYFEYFTDHNGDSCRIVCFHEYITLLLSSSCIKTPNGRARLGTLSYILYHFDAYTRSFKRKHQNTRFFPRGNLVRQLTSDRLKNYGAV